MSNPVELVLDIAKEGFRGGPGWAINPAWAQEIINRFNLDLAQGPGDMTGERSAIFLWKGEELRLKKEFPSRWQVYKGAWKPDPRWTGD